MGLIFFLLSSDQTLINTPLKWIPGGTQACMYLMNFSANGVIIEDAKCASLLATYSISECPELIRNVKQSQVCNPALYGPLCPADNIASPTLSSPVSMSWTTGPDISPANFLLCGRSPSPVPFPHWLSLHPQAKWGPTCLVSPCGRSHFKGLIFCFLKNKIT